MPTLLEALSAPVAANPLPMMNEWAKQATPLREVARLNMASDLMRRGQVDAPSAMKQAARLEAILSQMDPQIIAAIKPVYHGTGRAFENLAVGVDPVTRGGFSPHGVSVSTDPKAASRYAMDFNPNGGANVRPLMADISKELSLSAREFEKLQRLVGKLDRGERLSELEDIGLEMLLSQHGMKYQPGLHPIAAIKAHGYDAISKALTSFAEQELLVFDPAKLKSAFEGKR